MADGEATHLARVRTESGRRARKWDEQDPAARYVCTCVIDYRLSLHRRTSAKESLNELRSYGQRLLGTFHSTELAALERHIEADGGAWTGCREAVEILTRNPKKGM